LTGRLFRSNEYMSNLFPDSLPRSPRAAYERQVWGEFFGDLIRSAREERTLSVEEVARASGMSASEWQAIEAGAVPRSREQLQAVAAGLAIEWEGMASLAIFCRQAWGR
jgi:ribosome-binding protein aMBF1 (putative translation factor)